MSDETILLKTVATFSGIVGRPLVLRHAPFPKSNGTVIWLPTDAPDAYRLLERQLAHILFASNADARASFTRKFVDRVTRAALKRDFPIEVMSRLRERLERMIDILEDHRIKSLWGMLYPGSQRLMDEATRAESKDKALRAHDSFLALLLALNCGVEIEPGVLDPFRPLCGEALSLVERKGYEATLAVARWLIARLVDKLLEGQTADANGRLEAFFELSAALGELRDNDASRLADYVSGTGKGTRTQADQLAGDALALGMRDSEELKKLLEQSEQEMIVALGVIREQLERNPSQELAVTVHTDRIPISAYPPPQEFPEDTRAGEALRRVFLLVQGLNRIALNDTGTSLDVSAYVERMGAHSSSPCFHQDRTVAGFRLLLLVDRSYSMKDTRTEQVERARRLFAGALVGMPSVTAETWGFQAPEDGEVLITKFDRGATVDSDGVGGDTPLHIGIRVAREHLRQQAGGKRHLVIITDGAPRFARADGRLIARKTLMQEVRNEVLQARRDGLHVSTLIVGSGDRYDLTEEEAGFMFGGPWTWRRLDELQLGQEIVRVVQSSFVRGRA